MEARIARLESDVAHLRRAMAEVKADLRSLRHRSDALIAEKANRDFTTLNRALDTWALVLYVIVTAALLGAMAHGFGWI